MKTPPKHNQEMDELLNAYIDGELSVTEAEQVERMLAEDPAALRGCSIIAAPPPL